MPASRPNCKRAARPWRPTLQRPVRVAIGRHQPQQARAQFDRHPAGHARHAALHPRRPVAAVGQTEVWQRLQRVRPGLLDGDRAVDIAPAELPAVADQAVRRPQRDAVGFMDREFSIDR